MHPRVIVSLLVDGDAVVNYKRFKYHQYLGDPINLARIFSCKEVDELNISDKSAFISGINIQLLADLSSVATVPLSYCGNVASVADAIAITKLGFEKVYLNSSFSVLLAKEIASHIGQSSLGRIIDIKGQRAGKIEIFDYRSGKSCPSSAEAIIDELEESNVGEVVIRHIEADGTFGGFEFELIETIKESLDIPLICAGGCGSMADISKAFSRDVDGVMASSFFTFLGPNQGILPNYPSMRQLENL